MAADMPEVVRRPLSEWTCHECYGTGFIRKAVEIPVTISPNTLLVPVEVVERHQCGFQLLDGENSGMSRADCDALCRDLAAPGKDVMDIEESSHGVWRVTFPSPVTHASYIVTYVGLFRQTLAAGVHEEIPLAARTLLGKV
jgi:hypothetical protein